MDGQYSAFGQDFSTFEEMNEYSIKWNGSKISRESIQWCFNNLMNQILMICESDNLDVKNQDFFIYMKNMFVVFLMYFQYGEKNVKLSDKLTFNWGNGPDEK